MMSLFSALYLIGAAQGIFLALVLAGKERSSLANRILASVMLLFSFELVTAFYHSSGLDQQFPNLIGATQALPFLYTPLFFLYAHAMTTAMSKLKAKHLWHLVPFLLVVAYTAPFYLMSGAEKLMILRDPASSPWVDRLFVVGHVTFGYSFVYLAAIIVTIEKHRRRIKDRFSTLDRVNLNWLRFLALGGLVTWIIALGFYVNGFFNAAESADPFAGSSDYVPLAVAAYVYAIGYLGLRQPAIFAPASDISNEKAAPAYAKSGVDQDQASDIQRRLLALMDSEAPHKESDLTLAQLASRLDVTTHNLSQVINSNIGETFYDFINRYRVDEVKRRIEEDVNDSVTLLSIGLDAGFNSKSSFNAVFKKSTGLTPSAFRKQIRR